jgi:IS30 family transposase
MIKTLRQAHNKPVPRSKRQDRKGKIPDMVGIQVRPPAIEDRQFPFHTEGDLTSSVKPMPATWALGTLVEPISRLLMLIKLPEDKPVSALNVLQGFSNKLLSIALPLRPGMAFDQGREMSTHNELSKRTGFALYFCDPHSPLLKGSNVNMNVAVWLYLSKITDFFCLQSGRTERNCRRNQQRLKQRFGGPIAAGGLPRTACKQPETFHSDPLKPSMLHFYFESATFKNF